MPYCRESFILEYCGTYYDTQRRGLYVLCLFLKPHKISYFEEELDEDACGHRCREEQKNNDTDDEGIEDTLTGPILEGVALRTKQLLKAIQEESFSGRMLLMQHTNAILKRLVEKIKPDDQLTTNCLE